MTSQQLAAGLAALKQKDYQQAIALLSTAQEQGESQKTVLRAQMGLVVAYQHTNQMEAATALCEQLQRSQVEKVRVWAEKWLSQQAPKPSSSADPTGFVPLDKQNSNSTWSPTGVVPLEKQDSNKKTTSPKSSTGFVPLEKQDSNKKTTPSSSQKSPQKTTQQETQSASKPYPPPPPPPKSPSPGKKDYTATKQSRKPPPPPPPPKPSSDQPQTIPANNKLPWKNAPPAGKRLTFKSEKNHLYRIVQIATVIACIWLVEALVDKGISWIDDLLYELRSLPFVNTLQIFYNDPMPVVAVILLVLFVAMPWLWDVILQYFYGLQFQSSRYLDTYSPQSRKMLQRRCRARGWKLPKIGILPLDAPVAMTYGHFPRTTRIVVSQGLLEQLEAEEIATVYAGELGHVFQWDFAIMSWGTLLCQIPYLLYWKAAQWGDGVIAKQATTSSAYEKYILAMSVFGAVVFSVVGYGLYWLWRWPFLLLSRWRCLRSDRTATNLTNDPNALSRALVKISLGMVRDIQTQGQTHWLLESCDLLFPIGHRQAMGTSSSYLRHRQTPSQNSLLELFPFDCSHPYRRWLLLNNSHPLLGERLQYLARYAQTLQVEPEFDPGATKSKRKKKAVALTWHNVIAKLRPIWRSRPLYHQGAPYVGMLLGMGFAICLIAVGWMGKANNMQAIYWLWTDRFWIWYGSILIGFSLGSFWRTNSLFPDIDSSQAIQNSQQLPSDAQTMPVKSSAVALSGRLLGRSGISNLLGQDSILHCQQDLVKLHGVSPLDVGKFFWRSQPHVWDWIGCQVKIIGWFRQGATPWIDVETWQRNQQVSHSRHPIWYTVVAVTAAIWGAYWLATGGV